MKTRLLSIVLLFSIVTPGVATWLWLRQRRATVRREVKHQMMAGLEREELQLLKFTPAEAESKLRWKHAKEFEYQGQMYDIVERQQRGDTTYYWCWWDYKETRINRQLDQLLTNTLGKDPQKKERQQNLENFFKTIYQDVAANKLPLNTPATAACTSYCFASKTIKLTPPAPPPRQAV